MFLVIVIIYIYVFYNIVLLYLSTFHNTFFFCYYGNMCIFVMVKFILSSINQYYNMHKKKTLLLRFPMIFSSCLSSLYFAISLFSLFFLDFPFVFWLLFFIFSSATYKGGGPSTCMSTMVLSSSRTARWEFLRASQARPCIFGMSCLRVAPPIRLLPPNR